MKVVSKKNNIIHLEFPSFKEITMTMGRVQEYYESGHKHLRNKVFTLEEFIDTFTDDDGDVSYYKSWSGFNVPGNKMVEFFNKFELTKRENKLRILIDKLVRNGTYYIIATKEGDNPTIDHEIVHARFYLDQDYRKAALTLVKQLPKAIYDPMKKTLIEMGYAGAVVNDEINAYLSTSSPKYLKDRFGLQIDKSILNSFKQVSKDFV